MLSLRRLSLTSLVTEILTIIFLLIEDSGFGDWSPWSLCSSSCNGTQSRSRQCFDYCHGDYEQSKQCGELACPGNIIIKVFTTLSKYFVRIEFA